MKNEVLVIDDNADIRFLICNILKEQDFKVLAERVNATFIQTGKINRTEVIDNIKSLGIIDVAVSINYSGVIADEIIDLWIKVAPESL